MSSIFDPIEVHEEEVKQYFNDEQCWKNFQEEVIIPRIKKLKKNKPMRDFAVGVYMPKDFPFGLGQSLDSICKAEGVGLFSLDCSQYYVERSRFDFFRHIIDRPFTVILLENFDAMPDSPEKKYIENLLIHSWDRDFIVKRNNFLVIFSTSKDYGNQTPELLKKIKRLEWYGNIRK